MATLTPKIINNTQNLSVIKQINDDILVINPLLINNLGTIVINGSISGTRRITIQGNSSSLLDLAGPCSFTGAINQMAGKLKISNVFGTSGVYAPDIFMNGILEYASSSDLRLTGKFFGAVSWVPSSLYNPNKKIIISGTGRLINNGYNIFEGDLDINNGYFRVGNNDNKGGFGYFNNISIASSGTLEFNRTDNYDGSLSFKLLGSGNAVVMTGSLSLRGTNHTYNGVFTINSGASLTLERKMSQAIFTNNGTLRVNVSDPLFWHSGTFTPQASTTFAGVTTQYVFGAEFSYPSTATGIVTGQIQSVGMGNNSSDFNGFTPGRIALVQRGVETFQVKVNNAINAGASAVIIYNDSDAITSPNVTSPIPVIMITQSLGQQILNNLNSGSVSANISTAAPNIEFNNTVTGTGTFIKSGSARLYVVVNIPNPISITAGSLRTITSYAEAISVSSSGTFEVAGGQIFSNSLSISGSGTSNVGAIRNVINNNFLSGPITLIAAARINSDYNLLTISNNIGGLFGLTFGGSGNIKVDGFISNTTLTKDGTGELDLTANNTYSGATTVSAGTLKLTGAGATGTNVTIINNSAIVIENNDGTIIDKNISGTGAITKNLNVKVIFTRSLSYTGATTINAGTFALGSGGIAGAVSGSVGNYVVNNGAVLEINRSNASTFSRPVSGDGALVVLGGGTASFTGALTHAGGTTVSAGTMSIGTGGTTGSITGDILNNATVQFNRSDALSYAGIISGTGNLIKIAAGTLTLTGSNTYSGTTTISAGVLRLGHVNALGSATSTVSIASGAALELIGDISFSRNLSTAGTGVSAGGALRNISGNNTFNGNYTHTAASRINSDAGTLTLSSAGTLTGTFNLTLGGGGNISVQRPIATSVGALIKDGTGTAVLSAANTYTGNTTISGGILQFATVNALYNNNTANWTRTRIIVNTGATFAINVGGTNEFTTTNVGTLLTNLLTSISNNGLRSGSSIGFDTTNSAAAFTISNNITNSSGTGAGAVGVVKLGTGTLVMSGTGNTYTGGTTINGGTLRAGNATCFGTGTITLNAGATLDRAGFTITNTIVNNGGTIIN